MIASWLLHTSPHQAGASGERQLGQETSHDKARMRWWLRSAQTSEDFGLSSEWSMARKPRSKPQPDGELVTTSGGRFQRQQQALKFI